MSDLLQEVRAGSRLPRPPVQRQILVAAGVSRKRLADELGVHPVTVGRWLAGTREPRGALRAAYASLLVELSDAAA